MAVDRDVFNECSVWTPEEMIRKLDKSCVVFGQHWSYKDNHKKTMEECAEFLVEANRWETSRYVEFKEIEEMCDAFMMLRQIMHASPERLEACQRMIQYKINRTYEVMADEIMGSK